MSKLIERLEKVGTTLPTPMGFGANRAVEKAPPLLLVALSGTKTEASASHLNVDACIVATKNVTKQDVKAARGIAGEALWGLWPESFTSESLDALKDAGGDFFTFSTIDISAEVLAEEELGRLITIPVDFPEELGHSLEAIPIDAIILSGLEESSPLSVKDLIQVRSVRDLVSKPVLLLRSKSLTRGETAVLQEIGVQGIVLDLRTMKVEDAAEVQEAIRALPPRKTKREQAKALLPRLSLPAASPQSDDDDGDDDDDDGEGF